MLLSSSTKNSVDIIHIFQMVRPQLEQCMENTRENRTLGKDENGRTQ